MKKTISLLLALACLLTLTACTGEKAIDDTFIDETLLYDENNIKVSATGITHVEDAYILHFKVDNRYAEGLAIDFKAVAANGVHLSYEAQAYRNGNACKQILSNSAATIDLRISGKEFALAGMDALNKLQIALQITTVSSGKTLLSQAFTIPVRSINTVSTPSFDGEVIFSANDILVSYKLVDGIPYFFVSNNYRQAVGIYLDDFSINGYYYDYAGLLGDSVETGMCSIDTFANLDRLMMPPGDTAQVQFRIVVSDTDGNYFMQTDMIQYECPMYDTGRKLTADPQVLYTDDQLTVWIDRFYDDVLDCENIYLHTENNTGSDVILQFTGCTLDTVATENYTHSRVVPADMDQVECLFPRYSPAEALDQVTLTFTLSAGSQVLAENTTVTLTFED